MLRAFLAALALSFLPLTAAAGPALDGVVQAHAAQIAKASRQTIGPVIAAITASRDPDAPAMLEAWAGRRLGQRSSDGALFIADLKGDQWQLTGFDASDQGQAGKGEITQIKPNAGVQGLIRSALVEFTLSDPDPVKRASALSAIARAPEAAHLAPLTAAAAAEPDPDLKAQFDRLLRVLTLRFADSSAERVAAIETFAGDISLEARAALNPLLVTSRHAAPALPEGANIARRLLPGKDFSEAEAVALLVAAGHLAPPLSAEVQRRGLADHIRDGFVGGVALAGLSDPRARDRAWEALEGEGLVTPGATADEIAAALKAHVFYDEYRESDPAVTTAAAKTLDGISRRVAALTAADLTLDALSLASIYFLAAVGLAITFGVMGVINMAHGEFIMMGAYTGYVVQLYVADRTLSILLALPLAFAVTFLAGVAMERLVIRHLYKRPLETLLATFGISVALQQIAKNVFGTQARPLTAPAWLDGQLYINDVVAISYIRVAIFILALIFLAFFLWLMKRTRLGLEVRAVTQNPGMAASMGIAPDRINMLTFGLGSGIAGIAGVAIGLFAKVTSELGSDYIVQSFMTVVVGGVGNIWGTLLGAAMIGGFQKVVEWLNPANTLAAQTWMILFVILFIQFRPRGIIALKGRAAGD